MKKIIFLFYTLLSIFSACAQNIGVNTTNPDASAALDINSNNKGLLIPRVNLQSVNDNNTIVLPATGLMVYNTNISMPNGTGFYLNNGTSSLPQWKKVRIYGDENIAFASKGDATVVQTGPVYRLPQQTELYDISNDFLSNGSLFDPNTFIAPVTGIYHFDGSIIWTTNNGENFYTYTLILVNAVETITVYNQANGAADYTTSLSRDIKLNAGDKVNFACKLSGSGPASIFSSFFSGHLIFRL